MDIKSWFAVIALSVLSGGCSHMGRMTAVDVSNRSGHAQYVDIVIETLQDENPREIDLKIEMDGRQKWLREFTKYNCRLIELRGAQYVWMLHDEKGLAYRVSSHVSAPLTDRESGCNLMRALLWVPARGAMAQSSYLLIAEDGSRRTCESTDVSCFEHIENPDMKGEIRIMVKLHDDSRAKVMTRSRNVLSMRTELHDPKDVREVEDEFYNPKWE